jgi:hypothetical protein
VDQITVVWDTANRYHITVERASRGISEDDVEDVLMDPETVAKPRPDGRDLYVGRTRTGRPLAVEAMGEREIYPTKAWPITEDRWRRAHGD